MKKYLFKILLIFILFLCSICTGISNSRVIKVIDGDTFYVRFHSENQDSEKRKVRVNGIDTFETKKNKSLFKIVANTGNIAFMMSLPRRMSRVRASSPAPLKISSVDEFFFAYFFRFKNFTNPCFCFGSLLNSA